MGKRTQNLIALIAAGSAFAVIAILVVVVLVVGNRTKHTEEHLTSPGIYADLFRK